MAHHLAGTGGFSIDASVRTAGDDRAGVERLLRYCARPPFALERLHAPAGIASLSSNDSHQRWGTLLVYRLPKPTPDGRTELQLTPLELLERLALLIPPPRVHRHRYHGVLAPNAKLPAAVVAIGRPEVEGPDGEATSQDPVRDGSGADAPAKPARIRWAVLLARIYGVLPLLCPGCGGDMKILAFLTDPPVVSKILLHLDLHHLPPPLAPARGPPQGDFLLDQTSGVDVTEAEPVPDFVFDQSLPDEFED